MATRIPPSLKRLNLTAIMARVQREQGWSAAEASDAELWYRRFLQLSLVLIVESKMWFVWQTFIP